ncbi:hypothetical protein SLH46_20785 [Draconibacterium sp. IB214405]|uniref:hypothetical protein n=1 Tax=Draconibacterium sp. IB214405 TaxID=3097352 RepID=UPI002A0C9CF4|nr:hypothetical protein [Draconibacterium sp. IB214405]MDX8341647.1 hypothetical protein [Draconibacterium sp. IB214405]
MRLILSLCLVLILNTGFSQQRTGFLVSTLYLHGVEGKAHGDVTFSMNFSDARITVKVVPEASSIVRDFKYLDLTFSLSDLQLISDIPGSHSYFKGIASDADGLAYKFTCKLAKNGKSTFELPELQLKLVGSEICKFTDSIN